MHRFRNCRRFASWICVSVLMLTSQPSYSQSAPDPLSKFEFKWNLYAVERAPWIKEAYADWRRLPLHELSCLDERLSGNIPSLILRGIKPTDARLRQIMSACVDR